MTAFNNLPVSTGAKVKKNTTPSPLQLPVSELMAIHAEAHNLFDSFGLASIVRAINEVMKDSTAQMLKEGTPQGIQSAWNNLDCLTELSAFLVAIHEPCRKVRAIMRERAEES
nr:hypothetical protein [uncultured Arsenicibacter sp.]